MCECDDERPRVLEHGGANVGHAHVGVMGPSSHASMHRLKASAGSSVLLSARRLRLIDRLSPCSALGMRSRIQSMCTAGGSGRSRKGLLFSLNVPTFTEN